MDGRRISSSLVRAAIAEGRLDEARRMLGSNYRLAGTVVRGQRLGSEIGVPTANVVPLYDQVLPNVGIYAGKVAIDGRPYSAAISIGVRPTIPGAGFAIEAHLLEFAGGDLYGRVLTVDFVERLRDELVFDSVEQLTQQMRSDIEDARVALAKHG
jgi:riboflavin kinase/FMN adenylyltransferase